VPYALEIKRHCKCIPPSSGTFINYLFSFFKRSFIFMEKHFIALRILGRASRRIYLWILTFSSYNTSGPSAPSSHEMRHKPFLGSMNPKTQNMRKRNGRGVESGKYEQEWYDDPSRRPPQ
jgi:hypothetical protein